MPPVHDYVIDNSTGANVRSDLNNVLQAIVSNNSSSSEPSTKYAYQWWADTNANILKLRNSANNAWISICNLDGTIIAERVVTASIADDAITSALIANDAVGADQLASNSVVSASIVDGSIVNADINASAAIAGTKIAPDFGSQTVETTGDVKTPTINGGQIGNRNMIINGAMRIYQRTSSTTGVSSNGFFAADRFKHTSNGATFTVAVVSEAPGYGFTHSYKLTVTTAVSSIAAGNGMSIGYAVEGGDLARLGYGDSNAKSFTLSFWVRSSLTGDFSISFTRDSKIVNRVITVSSANTWQKVETTVAGDTATAIGAGLNSNGFNIKITPSAGSNSTAGSSIPTWGSFHNAHTAYGANMGHLTTVNSTFQITGVQMEVGNRASDFEFIPYQEELQRCRRYYTKYDADLFQDTLVFSGLSRAGTAKFFTFQLPVAMRGDPTITRTGNIRMVNLDDKQQVDGTSNTLNIGGVTPTTQLIGAWTGSADSDKVSFYYNGSISGMNDTGNAGYMMMFVSEVGSQLEFDAEL